MGGNMKTAIILSTMIILAMTNVAVAVDLSGTWQGMIKNQHVLKLTKKPGGRYHGEWFNLGQEQEGTLNGNPISSVDFDGSHLKFTLASSRIATRATYLPVVIPLTELGGRAAPRV